MRVVNSDNHENTTSAGDITTRRANGVCTLDFDKLQLLEIRYLLDDNQDFQSPDSPSPTHDLDGLEV